MYYQSKEDSVQTWKGFQEEQEDVIRQESAFHMSIYKLDKAPIKTAAGSYDSSDVRYQGDLWFDIDHKPSGANPTQADYDAAINAAITDVKKLLDYFISVGLLPKFCRLFASGGKGFHVCVPATVFRATAPTKFLPLIHKHMARLIQQRAETAGIDMATYNTGRGKMLRVENKPRANGRFKVPVTYDEILEMTPESYIALTSKPRIETIYAPPKSVDELCLLYIEAEEEQQELSKIVFTAISSAQMDAFSDGDNPTCVDWIVQNHNIKAGDGKFNRAKMSLARYLANAPITDAERNRLADEFVNNWESTHCPTVESRHKALQETMSYGREEGFLCPFMTNILTENPCPGCKIQVEQRREVAEASPVEVDIFGYFKTPARGPIKRLANFHLEPKVRYISEGDPANTYKGLTCDLMQTVSAGVEATKSGSVYLENSVWRSAGEFKKAISHIIDAAWFGNDDDLQHIKLLLTNAAVIGVIKTVEHVSTIGIQRHLDEVRGIDEYVWVEEDYSFNTSGLVDTLKFKGITTSTVETRSVKLQGVTPYQNKEEEVNDTLRNLFKVNTPGIVGPTLGWVMGCWLRTHIRTSETTDKHLPALQIYGSSGHGKTETATLFSLLAGADYISTEPLVVSSATPFAIRCEAAISTTIPRIFDEMNEHRIVDRSKYVQAYEAVKMSARGGTMPSGKVSKDNGLELDNKVATAPIIMLATQLNSATEIHERTIPLSINRVHRNEQNADAFRHVRDNPGHLIRMARTAMETTIHLSVDWVDACVERNHKLMPKGIQDRVGGNWRFALVGLDYFEYILTEKQAPRDIIETVIGLKQNLLDYLTSHEIELSLSSETQEIDKVIDTFGEMVIQDTGYSKKFNHGEHYIVVGDTLHIWSSVFFPQYVRYSRQVLMRPPELSSIKQYQDLLQHQPYALGSCPPVGVKSPAGWHSFHIPGLKERSVRVENFLVD
jgi:hypothetical protein